MVSKPFKTLKTTPSPNTTPDLLNQSAQPTRNQTNLLNQSAQPVLGHGFDAFENPETTPSPNTIPNLHNQSALRYSTRVL
jgi:hypothetical protein